MDASYSPSSSMSLSAAKLISAHTDVFSVPGYLVEQLRSTGNKVKEFSGVHFRALLHRRKSTLRDDLAKLTSTKQSRFTKAELTALLVRQGRHERDEQAALHLPVAAAPRGRRWQVWKKSTRRRRRAPAAAASAF